MNHELVADLLSLYDVAFGSIRSKADDLADDAIARNLYGSETTNPFLRQKLGSPGSGNNSDRRDRGASKKIPTVEGPFRDVDGVGREL